MIKKKKMATKIKKTTTTTTATVKEEKVNSFLKCNHYKKCSIWEDIHRTIAKGLASKVWASKEDKTIAFVDIDVEMSYSFAEATAKHCSFFEN